MRLLAAAASLSLLTAVAACGGDDEAAAGDDTTVVKVGTLRGQPHFYAPLLYEDGDGITYEAVTLDTAPALNDALVSGQVDMVVGSITATIASVAQGRDLRIVANAADGGSGFVGNDTIQSVTDVEGKKFGYLVASSQEIAMRLTFEEAGVDADAVELVELAPPEFFNAFSTGQIDGFWAPEIAVSLALGDGGHEVASPYETEIGRVNIALITTQRLIDDDPDLVQKVVDEHTRVTEEMTTTQDVWLKDLVETYGGDQEVFETALDNFWLRADIPDDWQAQIQALIDASYELGKITEKPELGDVVVDTFAETS
ncbi:UNVERIFIED_CONTAM: hypothetical protein LK11_46955 [Mumia flava]